MYYFSMYKQCIQCLLKAKTSTNVILELFVCGHNNSKKTQNIDPGIWVAAMSQI